MNKEIKLKIRYTGGDAEYHKLNLYDASISLRGLAKAISISSNAVLTKGAIRNRGTNNSKVEVYLLPSSKGSFLETISIILNDPAVTGLAVSTIATIFYDMIDYTWRKATGKSGINPSKRLTKVVSEEDLDEVVRKIEIPLKEFHRPIDQNSDSAIEVIRPRKGIILCFNSSSNDYLANNEEVEVVALSVNVTRYNINSGYGRAYIDSREKTESIYLDRELKDRFESTIIQSLNNSSKDYDSGKILIDAKIVKGLHDTIKIIIINNIYTHDNNE